LASLSIRHYWYFTYFLRQYWIPLDSVISNDYHHYLFPPQLNIFFLFFLSTYRYYADITDIIDAIMPYYIR
jgi:hypothetical protein